jgi:4-aminobutyrate aminotransferase
MGERLQGGLREAFTGHVRVGDIRGRGLAIGIDLVTGEGVARDGELARKAVYRLWQLGAVAFYVGGNVIELTPPLVITEPEVDQAVTLLVQAVSDAVAGVVGSEEVDAFAGW